MLKAAVISSLSSVERISVIDGFFYLVLRKNRGAAWSFLAEPDWGIYLLAGTSLLVTLVLLYLLFRTRHVRLKVYLTIICAGSIGNLIDRIRYGAVTDFLDFHFGSYIFPTFNLADSLIVCGTILLCLLILRDPDVLNNLGGFIKKPAQDDGKEGGHAANHPDP